MPELFVHRFNWSPGLLGHSIFTEEPVWAAKVRSPVFGETLRLWEFDRYNNSVWQVDIVIDDKETLWVHKTITNTEQDSEIRGYDWTVAQVPWTVRATAFSIRLHGLQSLANTCIRHP